MQDRETLAYPLVVEAGAPTNALRVASNGRIGVGTLLPQQDIHIITDNSPTIRMEQDGSGAGVPYAWDLVANHGNVFFRDVTSAHIPFLIDSHTPSNTLWLRHSGNIGIGTALPQAPLHLYRADGTAMVLVTETNPTVAPRTLVNLQNNGRPEIVLGNTATNGEWSFGAGTNFIIKQGTVGSNPAAKTKLFEITPAGNATLSGTLTTGGPSCGGGCDAVFAPGYDLPSIEGHAAEMTALGYLPNVGPTSEGAPLNVTDKLGGVLNELEQAHLYIAALDRENAQLRADLESSRAETARRLDRLEQAVASGER